MGIKHTPLMYYSIQVTIKFPSSIMKLMANYSDKSHSELMLSSCIVNGVSSWKSSRRLWMS